MVSDWVPALDVLWMTLMEVHPHLSDLDYILGYTHACVIGSFLPTFSAIFYA